MKTQRLHISFLGSSIIALAILVAAAPPAHGDDDKDDKKKDTDPDSSAEPTVNTVEVSLRSAVEAALKHHPLVTETAVDTKVALIEADRKKAELFGSSLSLTTFGRQEGVYNEFPDNNMVPDLTRNLRSVGLDTVYQGRLSFGGIYQVRLRSLITEDAEADLFVALTPRYSTEVSARYVQPLLRGGGKAANEGQVERERINASVTESAGREQIQDVVLGVVTAYWNLVLRGEELRIRRANLASAKTLREVVKRRVRAGSDARTSLIQADATVAERRQVVNAARLGVVEAESTLLRISYFSRSRKLEIGDVLVPSEKFDEAGEDGSFSENLAQALRTRPEVRRAKEAVRLAELDRKLADDAKSFRLDLYGDVGMRGVSGRTGEPNLPGDLDGGIDRSLRNLGTAKAPFFEVGVILEIPFDNGERVGAERQAALRVRRAKATDVETQIGVDIREAMRRLQITKQSLEVSSEALRLSEENVAGQERRYKGGGGTLFDVLRAQDERSTAEGELALARAQHEVALSNLDAARGTLLKRFGIDRASSKTKRKKK